LRSLSELLLKDLLATIWTRNMNKE
jgi:hypothetical protein